MPSFFKSAVLTVMLLLLVVFVPLPSWGQDSPPPEFSRGNPDKYKSAEECGECHELEFEVWKKTRHAIGFKEMHREDSARKIAKKLGFRRIKANSLCIACHYTPTLKNDQLKTTSGVSCEACHGPGKDWINIHNDYGGRELDYKTESPAHRARRIQDSRQAGMMRPSDLYPVVENCFQCHLVPNEELVNVGGHGTGTGEFEFVKMANEIRHNFLLSVRNGSKENAVRSVERLRLMYVVGQTVQLEYVLRSLAIATKKGTYATSMIDRVTDAMADMSDLSDLLQISELKNLGEIVEEEALKPNNKSLLLKAASTVSEATKLFLKNHDGSKLKALDSEINHTEADEDEIEPGIDDNPTAASLEVKLEGKVALNTPHVPEETVKANAETKGQETEVLTNLNQSPVPVEQSPTIQAKTPKDDQRTSVLPERNNTKTPIQEKSVTPVITPKARPTSKLPPRVRRSTVEGIKKSTIRPKSKHKTIGPRSCGKCHSEQTKWWLDDKHKNTHKPFTAKKGKEHEKAVKIAKLYGVKLADMAKGTQVCMNCHGTVISKKRKKKVRSGVSCESCHGPAKGYLEPHEEGEKDLGAKRPGYIQGLKFGLVKLKDEAVRAETCASCHYITDKRLISSGHSSGEKFKYAERVKKIKHWESQLASPEVMTKAYDKVLANRGPVPKFEMASVPELKSRPKKPPTIPTKKEPLLTPHERTKEKFKVEIHSEPPSTPKPPVTPDSQKKPKLKKNTVPTTPQPPPHKQPTILEPEKKHNQSHLPEAIPDEVDEGGSDAGELDPGDEKDVKTSIIRDSLPVINEAIKKLDFGEFTFDAPASIEVNETTPIALVLRLDKTIKALNHIIKKNMGKVKVDVNIIGRMEARLSGRHFSISTITAETQTILEKDVTEWKWEVSPTKEGTQKLHVKLSALISIGGKSTLKEIKTFDQTIEINAGFAGQAKNYFLNNWQWIWAIAFFSGIAWWRGKKSA